MLWGSRWCPPALLYRTSLNRSVRPTSSKQQQRQNTLKANREGRRPAPATPATQPGAGAPVGEGCAQGLSTPQQARARQEVVAGPGMTLRYTAPSQSPPSCSDEPWEGNQRFMAGCNHCFSQVGEQPSMAGGGAIPAGRCCPHWMTLRRESRAERWPGAEPVCWGSLATGQGLGVCRRVGGR